MSETRAAVLANTKNNLTVTAVTGAAAQLNLKADQSNQDGDRWSIKVANDGTDTDAAALTINTDVSGSSVPVLTIDPATTAADSTTTVAGDLKTEGNLVIKDAVDGIIHTNTSTVTQESNHTTGVTIHSTSGIITLAAVALNATNNAEFTVTNNCVKTTSVIILSMQDENTTDNVQLACACHTIGTGSFKISIVNPHSSGNTSLTASKIHFLIINPS